MNTLRRLIFSLWYYRRPPWDSGIVPPEVVDFIASHEPGRALDLGCGSGTSSLALAHAGWRVTGVDFAARAIRIAKQKAKIKRLAVEFRVGDVTRLPDSLFSAPCDLVLDIGCFHGLSTDGKSTYIGQLPRLLAPNGTWMLYGFFKSGGAPGPGLQEIDLEHIKGGLDLIKRQDGTDKIGRSSAWLWFSMKVGKLQINTDEHRYFDEKRDLKR
jgi:SAM-dependent methyltransferase